MSSLDRRKFLKVAGAGTLAARLAVRSAFGRQAEASRPAPPPSLAANEVKLPQIKAEPWMKFDDGNVFLKGMAFDRNNDLLVMAAYPGAFDKSMAGRVDRRIVRITPQKNVSTVLKQHGVRLCDLAVHKDGRIFIACLTGELLVVNPDGSGLKPIKNRLQGKPEELSDLTFDSKGYLYVTDFKGKPSEPAGGVYRWSPDLATVEKFGPPLVTPNGIAFTPDERSLWVSCSQDRQVSYLTLDDNRNSVASSKVIYKMMGVGGDGIRVDVKGNMYLAVDFEGRVLIFNRHGEPIANVLLPGRDRGELLGSSNSVFKPDTNEVYMVASGVFGGTWIYRFEALANGLPLFSHQ